MIAHLTHRLRARLDKGYPLRWYRRRVAWLMARCGFAEARIAAHTIARHEAEQVFGPRHWN